MARIEDYLRMNCDEIEKTINKEKVKIRKAKTEIALLEKLKIAIEADSKRNGNEENIKNGNSHYE